MTHGAIEIFVTDRRLLYSVVISSSLAVFYYRSRLVETPGCTLTAFARYIMAYTGFMLSGNEIWKQLQFFLFTVSRNKVYSAWRQ